MKKNDIEEATVKFKRKILGKNEFWRYRKWSTKGKVFLVLDAYPAKGERSVLSESLTDVLVSKQVQKLGGRGYFLFQKLDIDYRYLIDPETTLPASPTFRRVRQGGIDWQLK